MLKKNADKGHKGIKIYLNAPVLTSNTIFLGATLLSIYLMRYLMLTTVALLNALTYVFIPVLSKIFIKEKITKKMLTGIALIISGIIIYGIWGGM
jgi:drug/metabolite transporter (DMT)-like permease